MNFNLVFKKEKNKKEDSSRDRIEGIFGDYDIRGVYPKEINDETFAFLAHALLAFTKAKKVVIGRDSRNSSLALSQILAKHFQEQGIAVIDAGLVTTPLSSWIARTSGMDTLMVTASHNAPNENGLKIYSRKEGPISVNNGLLNIKEKLIELIDGGEFPELKNKNRGSLERYDFNKEYQKDIIKSVGKLKGNLRIAIDYSSGTMGLVLNEVLEKIGVNFNTINEEPNGNFPGHSPNPLKAENHQQIKWLMKNGRYNLGVIFDGDGDRIIFFDERGDLISTAHLFALLIDFYLAKSPRSKNIVTTASFSKIAGEIAKDSGGDFHVSPVGRTNVSPLMRKHRSLMGAERSGHYFFKEIDYQDSAVIALVKTLKILEERKQVISKLIKPFYKYSMLPEINIPLAKGTEKFVLEEMARVFSGGKKSRIDGLNIEYKNWWLNLRSSNTEDLWRLTLEGENEDFLEQKHRQIEELITSFELED